MPPRPAAAILFDRDGTLIDDLPGNTDPDRVRPVPGAVEALARVRAAGVAVALVTNQGRVHATDGSEVVARMNEHVEVLLGPLGPHCVCPHVEADRCGCRKPAPGLVLEAASRLGVEPARCVLIGDIGKDVEAAYRAGARSVLVPTVYTRRDEIRGAPRVARTLLEATDLALELLGAHRSERRDGVRAVS